MKYGEKAEWFASLASEGVEIPPEYDDPPTLYPDLMFDWRAFITLARSRQQGLNGPGSIAISEVLSYCDLLGLRDPESRVTLLQRVQTLDSEFIRFSNEKQRAS